MKEFRVEVVFETPVIFIAPPSNVRGPIMNKPIYYLNGSKKSYDETMVLEPEEQVKMDKEAVQRVHTADDERASWVTLLSNLQKKERDSRAWDTESRLAKPPIGGSASVKAPTQDHKHIFPLSFEIIGMLGQVVRLRGSSFRMIPNPTQDNWLKKTGKKPAWTITKLMAVFQKRLIGLSKDESNVENTPGNIQFL
ncbi:hypothetical protein DID88_003360 [Monilinia fructigena]|uniref:Uncharacterized protein n=1 Tax=Monilinia fructigena TaxID=38457 RepID=A0A395IWC4_9HELO|nr:hypothetical protein DID88_003360 [Monilinia fructigena]